MQRDVWLNVSRYFLNVKIGLLPDASTDNR